MTRISLLLLLFSSFLFAGGKTIDLSDGLKVNVEKGVVMVETEIVNEASSKGHAYSPGLEFIMTIGMDKDYEAVFSSKVKGSELHMALLMIGLVKGKADNPQSTVSVSFEQEGVAKPLNHYLVWSNGEAVKELGLHFAGSNFMKDGDKKIYGADVTLNLIAAYPAPEMVVGPSVQVANPYANEETPHLIPSLSAKVGAKGWMIFSAKGSDKK